jgi:hypothetical protein
MRADLRARANAWWARADRLLSRLAIGLLGFAACGMLAVGAGVLLKPSNSYWCPELPYPAWVLLIEVGEGVSLLATLLATFPVLTRLPKPRPVFVGLWCLAILGCVAVVIANDRMVPTGCG